MSDLFGPGWFDESFSPRTSRMAPRSRRAARAAPEREPEPEEVQPVDAMPEETKNKEAKQEEAKPAEDYLEQLRRVQADFINYKRRVEQEREEQAKCASKDLILRMLPVLDDLERALGAVPEEMADDDLVKGMGLIQRKLMATLVEEGLERMDVEGAEFDPREHEAVFCEESAEHRDGEVKSLIRSGYRLHGKVIRPAQVVVCKAKKEDGETVLS